MESIEISASLVRIPVLLIPFSDIIHQNMTRAVFMLSKPMSAVQKSVVLFCIHCVSAYSLLGEDREPESQFIFKIRKPYPADLAVPSTVEVVRT